MPKKPIAQMSAAGSKSNLRHKIQVIDNDDNDNGEPTGNSSGGDGEDELSEGERELLENEAKAAKKGKGKGKAKGKDDEDQIGEDTKRMVRIDSSVGKSWLTRFYCHRSTKQSPRPESQLTESNSSSRFKNSSTRPHWE
jgi:hypothetical protein